MIKYDNCKNCVRLCEHAGKDREFVCPGGVSCKSTAAPVGAFGSDEMINAGLRLLDIQRAYCIEQGADPKSRWFSIDGPWEPGQNSYYNGHLNMIDHMLLHIRKTVVIDDNGRHHIADLSD